MHYTSWVRYQASLGPWETGQISNKIQVRTSSTDMRIKVEDTFASSECRYRQSVTEVVVQPGMGLLEIFGGRPVLTCCQLLVPSELHVAAHLELEDSARPLGFWHLECLEEVTDGRLMTGLCLAVLDGCQLSVMPICHPS